MTAAEAQSEVDQLRASIADRTKRIRAHAHRIIARLGRSYSREIYDSLIAEPWAGSVSMPMVQAALRDMERDGVLCSELVTPPGRQGMARRYYWLAGGEP